MFFVFYFLNHIAVTLLRAYNRTEKLKYLYPIEDYRDFSGFRKGIERRVFRPSTFAFSLVLAIAEYLIYISLIQS